MGTRTLNKGKGRWTRQQVTLDEHQPVVTQNFFCGVPSHLKEAAVQQKKNAQGLCLL